MYCSFCIYKQLYNISLYSNGKSFECKEIYLVEVALNLKFSKSMQGSNITHITSKVFNQHLKNWCLVENSKTLKSNYLGFVQRKCYRFVQAMLSLYKFFLQRTRPVVTKFKKFFLNITYSWLGTKSILKGFTKVMLHNY